MATSSDILGGATLRHGILARLPRLPVAQLDLPILLLTILLMVISLLSLHSATGGDAVLVSKQAVWFGLGFLAMITLSRVEVYHFRNLSFILYLLGIFLLVLALLVGKEVKGAQRWLSLGPVNFQPADYMKIVLPLTICSVLTYKPLPIGTTQLLTILGLVLLPVFLVFLQPDLGTAIIMVGSSSCLIFLAGLNLRTVAAMLAMIIASLPLAWTYLLHDYHKERILSFLNPELDPLNSGWSVIQSKIAIGTGGWFGKGWGNSQQARYEFLPEAHTDFIFSVFSEEFGFLGVLVLLLIYLLLIARGVFIAVNARDSFEKLFCSALIFMLCAYALINIFMVTGFLPIVGVPLPLVSYGGTALLTTMGAFGMLMSVAVHNKKVI